MNSDPKDSASICRIMVVAAIAGSMSSFLVFTSLVRPLKCSIWHNSACFQNYGP